MLLRASWMIGLIGLSACGPGDLKRFEEDQDARIAANGADFPLAAYEQAIYLLDLARGSCPERTIVEEAGTELLEAVAGDNCVASSGLEWSGTIVVDDIFTAERVQRTVLASDDFSVRSESYDNLSFSGELVLTGPDLNQLQKLDTADFSVTINGTTISYTEYELIGDVSQLLRETIANVSLESEVTHEGQNFSLGGVWDFEPGCETEPKEGVLTATGDNQITITLNGSDCDGCANWQDTDRDKRSGKVCNIRTEVAHFFNEVGD